MSETTELMTQIASAGARIKPALTERDVDRVVAGVLQRRRRGERQKVVRGGALALVALVGTGVVALRRPHLEPATPASAPPTATRLVPAEPSALRFADGSRATPLDPSTQMTVRTNGDRSVEVTLDRGRSRFDITPRPDRTFLVRAGDVTITVLGTVFTVERIADRIGLSVESGRVQVDWGTGKALLGEGDTGWYPPLVETKGPLRSSRDKVRAPRPASAARALRTDSAEELMRQADSARQAGRADDGATALRTLLREHRGDVRAPLAAFTLGRMLLIELHDPAGAAEAFGEARSLAPGGPLAEDALAREVQAWEKAGQPSLAKLRAEEYLHLHPNGRREGAVRKAGGIE